MRTRRGRIRSNAACVVATVLALAIGVSLPNGDVSAAPRTPGIRALHFPISFVAQQVAGAAGSVWVLGTSSPSSSTECSLWKVDPSNLTTRSYPLPQCASDIASGDGRVYLLVNQEEPSSNTRDYHIEVFDPAAGIAQVLAPIVLQNVGSAVAHTDLSYGDGSLWLYGYALGGIPEVVQISPDSGDVESTIDDPPQIGGTYPTVVANTAGVWLGGGPGGPGQVVWVHAGSGVRTTIPRAAGDRTSSVLWLSDAAGHVWAGIAEYGGAPGTTKVTTRLVALTDRGTAAVHAPAGPIEAYPIQATPDGRLWDVAYGRCGAPAHVLEINPDSGVSRTAASLRVPATVCDNESDGSELTVAGGDVFALFPTGGGGSAILYRVAP